MLTQTGRKQTSRKKLNRHSFFQKPLYQMLSGHYKKFSARFEHKLIHKGLNYMLFLQNHILQISLISLLVKWSNG
jgi:hypothetical protein